jgi:hypothetical protein
MMGGTFHTGNNDHALPSSERALRDRVTAAKSPPPVKSCICK